ncbi:fructosamine kinase family protein [Thalassolituus sp. LLYu03]|uniref:fructosamine kinase family protein n=1 Tax=Thalassolituus sp. LLYu03 TaxID=3421656 RepID=UPI003D2A04D9
MNSAFSLHHLSDYRDDQVSRELIGDILEHAVANRQLFPSAVNLNGFSQHKNRIQQQFTVQTEAGAFFIKCQDVAYRSHFEAEQRSLLALMGTHTMAVCAPLAIGTVERQGAADMSYLILQHIPLAVHGDWFSAGQQLAQLHGATSDKGYGFDGTTWCGETPQDNRWRDNWADFFLQQRLQPQFGRLAEQGVRIARQQHALECAYRVLRDHQPTPALLHGDLWSGNIGFNPDRQLSYPVLFDPASYYGDAETDLAMTELFGRFPKAFYDGYQSVTTIDAGYRDRMAVYQLYHVLNHALMFGGSYVAQAESLIRQM